MRSTHRRIAASIALAVLLAACQTTPAGNTTACKPLGGSDVQNAGVAAVAGALVGAAIGSTASKKKSVGARNGALAGALIGGLAGSQYNSMIGVTELPDGSVRLNIPGSVMFRTGSAEISPEFASTLNSVGSSIQEYCGVTATVVGHTDSTGPVDLNERLSMDRASAVVSYLSRQGVPSSRLRSEGRGPRDPVATNNTEQGRAQNRRVEVLVRPPAS